MIIFWFSLVPAWAILATASACITYPLNSDKWQVVNENKSIKAAATVPGGIYTDLRKAGVLPEDVFYRLNDQEYRWVSRDSWTYSTNFDVTEDLMGRAHVYLTFHGLDTIASVTFNNHSLGETNNMFVRFRFNVKDILKLTGNYIEVRFASPITAATTYAKASTYDIPPACVNKEFNGECHVNYLRKMQASFAWDWGPAFPSVGIWKSVTLEGYNSAFARSISVVTASAGNNWNVTATFYFELPEAVTGATLILQLMDHYGGTTIKELNHNVSVTPDKNLEGQHVFIFSVSKNDVRTWWPNGLGDQPLYFIKCIFRKPDEDTDAGVMVGFRTIELVQDNVVQGDNTKGYSFYFKVNNVPFFAKGTNFIPASILPELSTVTKTVDDLLGATKEANMNMIRVWGGGLYESDYFYYVADKLGILVWQDMAFACSLYPADETFLSNVATEIKQQVRRLQSHPSLAVWTGNNENEGALRSNWWGISNFSIYENDYKKLYAVTVKSNVVNEDSSRPFLLSSPSNGKETEEEGGIAKNPGSSLYGDVHFYNYDSNLWTTEPLPSTRFASEYGIMSMPSYETLLTAAQESELTLESQVIQSRQHHLGGYTQLLAEIAQNLPVSSNMKTFVYYSQINQAMGIKTQTENYRRLRNTLNEKGEGHTMGALYWQLNDVWQAPSWSSIDFNNKWKMLHYYAKNFFHPVLVSPALTQGGKVSLSLISDLLNIVPNVEITIYVYHWSYLIPQYEKKIILNMTENQVTKVLEEDDVITVLSKADKCGTNDNAKKNCFLYYEIKENGTKIGPDNFLLPSPLHSVNGMKNATIKVTGVHLSADSGNGSHVDVEISTDNVAAFVWLEAADVPGHFSDNGFILVTESKTVTFYAESPVDIDNFKKVLKIKSLVGAYTNSANTTSPSDTLAPPAGSVANQHVLSAFLLLSSLLTFLNPCRVLS